VYAKSYANDEGDVIDITLSKKQARFNSGPVTIDFPHLDLTDSLMKKINELLGCEIRKVQCRCFVAHEEERDSYEVKPFGMNMTPDFKFSSDPPLEYNIQFHNLLRVSDATSVYVMGAFAMKNLKNGKTVVLPVEFRLFKSPNGDNGDLKVKGTARWLEPVVGDWERAWGFRLDDYKSSQLRETDG
jgi:hypothetical protein